MFLASEVADNVVEIVVGGILSGVGLKKSKECRRISMVNDGVPSSVCLSCWIHLVPM